MIFCLIMDHPDDNFLSETIDVFITATAETWGCPRIPIPSWQFSWTVFAGDASNGDTQFKLTLEGQPSLCSTANEPGADKATIVTTESPHLSSGVFFLLMLLCSVFHLWIWWNFYCITLADGWIITELLEITMTCERSEEILISLLLSLFFQQCVFIAISFCLCVSFRKCLWFGYYNISLHFTAW